MSAYAAAAKAAGKKIAIDKSGEAAAKRAGSGSSSSAANRLRENEGSVVDRINRNASNFMYSGGNKDEDSEENGKGGNKSNKNKKSSGIKKIGGIVIISSLLLVFAIFILVYPIFQIGHLSEKLALNSVLKTDADLRKGGTIIPEALSEGSFPATTAERMKDQGYPVGYMDGDTFVESNQGIAKVAYTGDVLSEAPRGELVVKEESTGKIITASEFYNEYTTNASLYNAVDLSTYGVAAYYYDESAERVFRELGTSRDDYNSNTDFDEVTSKLMGEGNNITFITVGEEYISATVEDDSDQIKAIEEDSDCEITGNNPNGGKDYVCLKEKDETVSGNTSSAINLIEDVRKNNKANKKDTATMNTADSLAIADGMSTEQRSMRFYVAVMQNISKVKAGYGGVKSGHDSILDVFATLGAINGNSGSNINDVMNMLYETSTTEVVDVKTGETVKVEGSMLQSPSLYSILTDSTINIDDVQNYSTERVLNTIENKTNTSAEDETISGSVVSGSNKVSGSIWRFIIGSQDSDADFSVVEPTISSSLTNNSFDTVAGVSGGELLAQGAVNLSAELTLGSGSSVGNEQALKEQAKMTDTVLALSEKADRLNRSPLDITSKNTFLGSIMYKFAMSSLKSGSILNKVASVSRLTISSFASLIPTTHADDLEPEPTYLTAVGNCKHYDSIGAVGTVGCSRNEVFDTTTYNNILTNEDYKAWRDNNVNCDGTSCTIKEGSDLAKYISYNTRRKAPIGVLDKDIINEETKNAGLAGSFLDIFRGLSSDKKMKASGEEYVNNGGENWEKTYKYCQAYISTARSLDAMRMYDGDVTAFNFEGFGLNNPVIAYINEHFPLDTSIAVNE